MTQYFNSYNSFIIIQTVIFVPNLEKSTTNREAIAKLTL